MSPQLPNHLFNSLSKWESRLSKTRYTAFHQELSNFFEWVSSQEMLASVFKTSSIQNDKDAEFFDAEELEELTFESRKEQVLSLYYTLKCLLDEYGSNILSLEEFAQQHRQQSALQILEEYINPIIYYLQDGLSTVSFSQYLVSRYKSRVELFTREELSNKYQNTTKKDYESILVHDFRLFLFDHGLNFPLTEAQSPSGKIDVIANVDGNDPLLSEVKIFDSTKGYRKDRVAQGLTQIHRYCQDYGISNGFLVVFVFDDIELELEGSVTTEGGNTVVKSGLTSITFVPIYMHSRGQASKKKASNNVAISTSLS